MEKPPGRRFDDTPLGQALPSLQVTAPGPEMNMAGVIERFVAAWAGQGATIAAARVTRQIPLPAGEVLEMDGRVYGRHMDGSNCIEVKVTGRDGLGARVGAMVRVKLA